MTGINSQTQHAASHNVRSARRSFSDITIRYRLPLLIGILLLGMILASTWASYEAIRTSGLEAGRERLVHLTNQFVSMLQQSSAALLSKTATAANDPAIRDFVRAPSANTKSPAVAVLEQFAESRDPNSIQTELWTNSGSPLLFLPERSAAEQIDLSSEFQKSSAEPFRAVGVVRVINDTAIFPSVAAVKDEAGKPLGYLVRWRKLSASAEARKQLTELLGSEATLYFGNLQEDLWTDMSKVVPKPPGGVVPTLQGTSYKREGNLVMSSGRSISGTPWFIAVEIPERALLVHAVRFLRRAIIFDLVLLLIGVSAAFAMSSSITRPLRSLTEAASGISHGDYSRRVNLRTHDELGTLARAFNTMVGRISNSQHELELNVQERTKELEEANRQLQLLSESDALKRTQAEKERTEAVDALRNTEAQLLQAQKLEAVGRLAGGVSHDFNNLLTAITGYSDLTLRRLRDGDPLRNYLKEIQRASERAGALTRQLLAFSRKQVLQPKVLDLNEVVLELEKMLRRLIGEDIKLRTSLQRDLGNVKADPGQIEQVIMNLTLNSRDAMPTGGNVTIETGNVYLDEAYARQHLSVAAGPYIMLAVSDTGTGMDAETQEHMFEPFYTTKEAGKGTGLGLSMVYGIVKQSGGNIWVYSEKDKGTTFKIYFPRVDAQAEKFTQSLQSFKVSKGSETILLVEDADVVRHLAREVLEESGYEVLEAPNAEVALEICQRHEGRIELLLTDVVMPGLSGSEVSKRVTALKPGTLVLYMSGYTDDAIVRHGVLKPGLNFIQKPFTPKALAAKVREVLDSAVESTVIS